MTPGMKLFNNFRQSLIRGECERIQNLMIKYQRNKIVHKNTRSSQSVTIVSFKQPSTNFNFS